MSMEYRPVGGSVADQEVRDWRARNYDTTFGREDDSSLGILTEQIDDMLGSAPHGLTYHAYEQYSEVRYANEVSEAMAAHDGEAKLTTSLEIVRRLGRMPFGVREQYHVMLDTFDMDGEPLADASYMILKFVGEQMELLIHRSVDDDVAALTGDVVHFDKGPDRWRDATEFDSTQLFDQLSHVQELQNLQKPEIAA